MTSETENTAKDSGNRQRVGSEPDIGIISRLIQSINIAIGKASAYPEGHPLVKEAMQQIEDVLSGLFNHQNQLKLGIAKNAIILGTTVLEPENQRFQSFAGSLFRHGIVGLTLLKGLNSKELIGFNRLILQSRNDILQQGGLEALISDAGIRHIKLLLIDYGLFHMFEGSDSDVMENLQNASFWSHFVEGLFQGILASGIDTPEGRYSVVPDRLGGMLNERYMIAKDEAIQTLDHALVSYLDSLCAAGFADTDESTRRVFEFVQSLNSDLRRHFLEKYLNSIPQSDEVADRALSGLPDDLIIEALDKHASREFYVPPYVLDLVRKLSKLSQGKEAAPIEGFINAFSRDDLLENMKTIFKEDEQDRFMPIDYQNALRSIVVADHLSTQEISEIEQLEQTLSEQNQNTGLAWIVAEIIATESQPATYASMAEWLRKCLARMVFDGDIQLVLNIMDTINRVGEADGKADAQQPLLAESLLSDPGFVYKALSDSKKWIKDRKFYVSRLIKRIGTPFIDPLLEHLAEEQSKTLRMFYIDTLKDMGPAVTKAIIKRLGDTRWYYVRNLLFILCSMNDPNVLDSVYRLLDHDHPRVRQELLRILVTFSDPKADGIILQEMHASDLERRLNAIRLAGKVRNATILQELIGILKTKGMNPTDLEMKKAVVHALAEIGDTSVLPVLLNIMQSFFLFSGSRSRQLKIEIAGSLNRYPKDATAPIVRKLGKTWAKVATEQSSAQSRALREPAS